MYISVKERVQLADHLLNMGIITTPEQYHDILINDYISEKYIPYINLLKRLKETVKLTNKPEWF